MLATSHLRQTLLVASPALIDQPFKESVVFVYEHDEQGALGVIINKPLNISMAKIFDHPDALEYENTKNHPVLLGGPINKECGLLIYNEATTSPPEKDAVELSSSKQLLTAISQGTGPSEFLFLLGYAAWQTGQLENEIAHGDWLLTAPCKEILFNTPIADRWQSAMRAIGIKKPYSLVNRNTKLPC